MKKILIPLLALLVIALIFSVFQIMSPSTKEPSSNFAFRFEFGSCNTDILDTFEGTFTQDRIVEPSMTVPLELSESQRAAIHQKMMEIDFFDYPDEFVISNPVGIQTPANEYRILVRDGTLTKSLHWVDDYFNPANRKSVNLDELFTMIMEVVWEHPEYKKLPDLKAGCL